MKLDLITGEPSRIMKSPTIAISAAQHPGVPTAVENTGVESFDTRVQLTKARGEYASMEQSQANCHVNVAVQS